MPIANRTMKRLLVAALALLSGASARHSERLTLRALPSANKVAAHFQFSVVEPALAASPLVPAAIAQTLDKYAVDALRLSFALGRYSHAGFGDVEEADAPFGARLQADLRAGEAVDERWRGLTAELGGIFSASLGQMDATVVTGLLDGSARENLGAYAYERSNETLFLHASLAREELCTENLTPWLKMLPCRSAAGLGRLIDPIKVLSGEYLALTLFAGKDPSTREWTLHQHLELVQHVDSKAPTIADLFGVQDHVTACPLADESVIVINEPTGQSTIDLQAHVPHSDDALFGSWTEDTPQPKQTELVQVHRFATGYGQVGGGLAVLLTNNHPTSAARVEYHDVLPWFLRMYFSTLHVESDDDRAQVERMLFEPAELRGRPNQFQVDLILPAQSSAVISVEFDKAFIRLSEHPPDANRGFDVASGVARFTFIDDAAITEPLTRFTEPLLIPLPTPDFSMPYNVITMTSTVVAFFVGSMLNSLLRKAPRIQQLMKAKRE